MASRSRSNLRVPTPALLLLIAVFSPSAALAGEPPSSGAEPEAAAAPHTVVVGKARLTWHLQPAADVKRAALVEAFRKATAAHLTGGEPYVTPKAEPKNLPGGQLGLTLPAELIHTLFVGPEGRNYCSDSTVPARAAQVGSATREDG